MNNDLLRLFLPTGVGIVLGFLIAFRGFLRACSGSPDCPGFSRLVAGLVCTAPFSKVVYALIFAFHAMRPTVGEGVPVFPKEGVLLVAGIIMGLIALAQGFVASARMPKLFATPPEETKEALSRGSLGPSGKSNPFVVTMMIHGFLETPALFAMVFGMMALQMTH